MDDLDFSQVEISDMIDLDPVTGMPAIGNDLDVVKNDDDDKSSKDKKNDKPVDDLLEIDDEIKVVDKDDAGNDDKGSDDEDAKNKQTPSSTSDVYKVMINALHEKGVLSSELNNQEIDKAINDGVDPLDILFELFNYEINGQVENVIKSFPEKIQKLISDYTDGVPLDEMINIKSEQQRLDKLTDTAIKENTTLQKEIIKRLMIEKGENETKINKHIRRLEELDDLEEEALDSYKELTDIYESKEEELRERSVKELERKEQERKDMVKNIRESIDSTDEIVPGIKLNKAERDAIFSSMTKPIGNDELGRPISAVHKTRSLNPIEFEKALHYYHHIGLFNFDKNGHFKPDFSKLTKITKNEAISDLKRILSNTDKIGGGKPHTTQQSTDLEAKISSIEKYLKK